MSDVIWAAAVAGGVSLVGNLATYFVATRQSKTTIAAAEQHATVELKKVEAELERLRHEYREAERSNRQGTYHRALVVINRMDMHGTGWPPDDEHEYMQALEELNLCLAGIHLFAPKAVRDALGPLAAVLEELGRHIGEQDPAQPMQHRYAVAYQSVRAQILSAEMGLIEAMRADVTDSILEG